MVFRVSDPYYAAFSVYNALRPDGAKLHLLVPPSWDPEGTVDFFFGTDDLGRDILSRIIDGSRLSFGAAVIITAIATLVGCLIGILAGMTRGLLSSTLNHLLDTVMSIPSLLLAIIFVAFLGQVSSISCWRSASR